MGESKNRRLLLATSLSVRATTSGANRRTNIELFLRFVGADFVPCVPT